MFKAAFSTVACPEWTLNRVFVAAAEYGFSGVELRTFGSGSRELACDPALTASEKVRRLAADAGVEIAGLSTGVSFGEPIRPPVIGRVIGDPERTVRLGKSALDLAAQIEAPLVRVFGFDLPVGEKRASGVARVRERLALVADGARNTGVRLVVENGGSFRRASELAELIEGMPLVGASYSAAVAADAGEDPVAGAAELGERLWVVKVKDRGADRRPCPIGEGEMRCREFVGALGWYRGWVVVEWDRLWIAGLESAEVELPRAARRLYEWSGAERMAGATGRA